MSKIGDLEVRTMQLLKDLNLLEKHVEAFHFGDQRLRHGIESSVAQVRAIHEDLDDMKRKRPSKKKKGKK